ncbi:MAG: MBL fold metallo-hydrolase [Betaproteobacteria bacterium]
MALILAGCSTTNPYYDPAVPHRGASGFRNNYNGAMDASYWRWKWEAWRNGLPHPPANGYRFPMAVPEVAWLQANRSEPSVTWIGHATLLLQIAGQNILTDPHLSARASPVQFFGPERRVPPGLSYDQLPHIDIVVISHNHYDHLDKGTVARLARQEGGPPHYLVPLGLKSWFHDLGIDTVTELDWWERRDVGGLTIHCVPVQHWSKRTLTDRNATLWSGWVIEHPSLRVFFAGDTGYSPDFADIGKRFGSFDLAAIPIGAYAPRWFMEPQHVDPAEAIRIHQDLHARQSLGIHWGTFELTDEPLDEPPRVLRAELEKQAIPAERFFVLQHGQTRRIAATQR